MQIVQIVKIIYPQEAERPVAVRILPPASPLPAQVAQPVVVLTTPART